MYRKQRKESEFKKTIVILKNGSDFKQKYGSLFHISTYLERVLLSRLDQLLSAAGALSCAFYAELCGEGGEVGPLELRG